MCICTPNINGEGAVEARIIIYNEYIPLDGSPILAEDCPLASSVENPLTRKQPLKSLLSAVITNPKLSLSSCQNYLHSNNYSKYKV
jgi:hypothetical protein